VTATARNAEAAAGAAAGVEVALPSAANGGLTYVHENPSLTDLRARTT